MQTKFSTIGLVIRKDASTHGKTINRVIAFLQNGAQVLTHCLDHQTSVAALPDTPIAQLVESSDLIISLGGDGTLLSTARALVGSEKPLLGINLGRLGFLADVPIRDFEQRLSEVLGGQYAMEKRFLIEGRFCHGDQLISSNIALNDIILHNHESLSMIEYEVYSDHTLIHQQRADGVIVTTPTGSTAYALSGGGPIMHPALMALAIVPICPHTLSNRPIVLPAEQKIEIRLSQKKSLAQINYDGQFPLTMRHQHRIKISCYPKPLTLLHPKDHDYFEILRAKLDWSNHY